MENITAERELVCILFPGIVKNEERALQCLGGLKHISQVYSNISKKRLGLSFQPENIYMKRIYGDMSREAGVLLKVRIKKKKENNTLKREVVSTAVVGRVKKVFKFESLCDFQYMPVHRESSDVTGPLQCLLDYIPTGLDEASFMREPAPYCITPANFTRSDNPVQYCYTDKRYITSSKDIYEEGDDLHNRIRKERATPVVRIEFNLVDEIPTDPPKHFLNIVEKNRSQIPSLSESEETLRKMFEERPIWSQNLIKYHTKMRHSLLKILLPSLAYYMRNGPWRMLWVRYGYDPRKEPGARLYQVLDFRLRHSAGIHSMVMTRDQVSNWRKADRVKFVHKKNHDEESLPSEEINESVVSFKPGCLPAQRQVFYMYCDIHLPEVQAVLSAEPPPGYLCHQKRGWLPHNTDQTVRDLIFKYVKEAIFATQNADVQLEQASSDDESNSERESSAEEPSTSNT